ncbi:MAG: peptidylprolyl isomerase [Proteobacteria bacterium]|nr:peptidylprolyl isomerase [Pseudomonadota bacterium]
MSFVRIKTNYGTMVAEIQQDKAPATAANFMRYVQNGTYNNTLFHRVIQNFMVQGGGLEPGMYSKSNEAPIPNEAANGLKNEKFTLAMARTPDPHSATNQFFINVADNKFLDYTAPTDEGFGYCVFGKLTEGMDIATRISEVPTEERFNYQDVPSQDVIIEAIEMIEETDEAAETAGSDE